MTHFKPPSRVGPQPPTTRSCEENDADLPTERDRRGSIRGQGACDPQSDAPWGSAVAGPTNARSSSIRLPSLDWALVFDLCLTATCVLVLTWAAIERPPAPANLASAPVYLLPQASMRGHRAPVDADEDSTAEDEAPEIGSASDR